MEVLLLWKTRIIRTTTETITKTTITTRIITIIEMKTTAIAN